MEGKLAREPAVIIYDAGAPPLKQMLILRDVLANAVQSGVNST